MARSTSSSAEPPHARPQPPPEREVTPCLSHNPKDLHARFAEALRAQDVEALRDLYEPDALVALPDGSQVTGPDALRGMVAGLIAAGADLKGTPRKVLIAGDIALASTSYAMQAGPAGGQATTVETAEVSRRQPDGSWRVVIDAPTFS